MRMNKNTKIITGSVVALAVIVVLGIVYAAFTQQLTINGTATGRSSSWKIYFSRLTSPVLNGTAKELTAPTIKNNSTTIGDYSVSVTSPGDYIEYEFDVTNDGDYDATLTGLTKNSNTGLTYTGSGDNKSNDEVNVMNQIEYTLKYTDGTNVAENDTLKSKETKTMRLRLTYKTFSDASLLPQHDVAISGLGISLTYTQDGNAKVNADGSTPLITYSHHVGDQITVANETYRVIANSSTSDDYVVALKENPLKASEITAAGGTANGTKYGEINQFGETSDYATSTIKSVVDSWATSKFTNSELKTVDGYSARLISINEASSLGYEWTDNGSVTFWQKTDAVPSWVYNSNYRYWTMSQYNDSSSEVWGFDKNGSLTHPYVYYRAIAVRPVINVYKSAISS